MGGLQLAVQDHGMPVEEGRVDGGVDLAVEPLQNPRFRSRRTGFWTCLPTIPSAFWKTCSRIARIERYVAGSEHLQAGVGHQVGSPVSDGNAVRVRAFDRAPCNELVRPIVNDLGIPLHARAQRSAGDAVRGAGATRLYGLETVTIRYFNVFGPRQVPSSAYSGVISQFAKALTEGRSPADLETIVNQAGISAVPSLVFNQHFSTGNSTPC